MYVLLYGMVFLIFVRSYRFMLVYWLRYWKIDIYKSNKFLNDVYILEKKIILNMCLLIWFLYCVYICIYLKYKIRERERDVDICWYKLIYICVIY